MSLWQTDSWQEMLVASNQSKEYFILEQDTLNSETPEKIYIEKRKVSLGEYGLFVIGYEGTVNEDLWEKLKELCKEENCLFVQIETIDYSGLSESGTGKYYKKFIPSYTALIDLMQSEDEILAAMKQKGRYNIKVARKKGVIVEQVDPHSYHIKKFHELMQETTVRDKFAGNTLSYYETLFEKLGNKAQLFFAYHDTEIIASGIFVAHEKVMTYYYGASSSTKRNLMAPYLLQWSAIEHAKKRGCKVYDFLGVAGDNEQNSPLAGVTDFKMKLSPAKTYISGSNIYIHKKLKYLFIQMLKKIK